MIVIPRSWFPTEVSLDSFSPQASFCNMQSGREREKKATPVHISILLHTMKCFSKMQFRPDPNHIEINGIRSLTTFKFAEEHYSMLKQPAHCW